MRSIIDRQQRCGALIFGAAPYIFILNHEHSSVCKENTIVLQALYWNSQGNCFCSIRIDS